MTSPYVDPNTIHVPGSNSPPASWGAAVRDGLEFLVRPAGCIVRRSSTQSIAHSTWTVVAWNGTDIRDTDNFHTGTSDEIVVPSGLGGLYTLNGSIHWTGNTTGLRGVRYTINGTGDNRLANISSNGSSGIPTVVSFSADVLLTAGDVLRFEVIQTSGAALTITADTRVGVRLVAVT
jgi:hypothetical protein